MPEYDVIKIETEYMRDLLAGLLHEILQKQKGYCVNFQIHTLRAVEEDEKIKVHVKLDAETDSKELQKICKDSFLLKTLVGGALKFVSNLFASTSRYHIIEDMIQKSLKETIKIKVKINKLKYDESGRKASASLDADIKVKKEDLEKSLENFELI